MPQRLSVPKIKARMSALGLNASRLQEKSQLSESTIDRILHGRATNYSNFTVTCLANALECPALDLFDDDAAADAIAASVSRVVESVVAEAVAEAVTVVVEETAPDVPSQSVAEAVPNIPVQLPGALDIPVYISHIKDQHAAEIAAYTSCIEELRRERNVWRTLSLLMIAACVVLAFLR